MRARQTAGRDLVRRKLRSVRLAVPHVAVPHDGRKEGEPMKEFWIILALAVLLLFAVRTVYKRTRTGGGCCGEHGPAVKRTGAKDRNRSHYPYSVVMTVGGMTCANCARRTENALNALDGIFASVDPGKA